MTLKIGIFSLKNNVGCTAMAIHMANYLAGSKSTVALIEPDTVVEPEFNTVKADFEDDGTFILNNVRYYPSDAISEPNEEIQIIDFGLVNYMFEFPTDINKLYICVSNNESDVDDVIDFINETGAEFEVIVVGGTKNLLQTYNDNNMRSILVGDKKEPRIDRMLADKLNLVLRRHFITPPEYHNDWEYAPTVFHYVPEDESQKKGFFGSLFGGKKKEQKVEEVIEDTVDEEIEEIIDINDTGVNVIERNNVQKANEYVAPIDFDFSQIPVPVDPVDTELNDEMLDSMDELVNETVVQKEKIDKKAQLKAEKEAKKRQKYEAIRAAQAEKEAKKQETLAQKELAKNERIAKKQEALTQKELNRQAKADAAAKRKAEIEEAKIKVKEARDAKRKADAEHRRKVDAETINPVVIEDVPKSTPHRRDRNMDKDDLFMDKNINDEPLYKRRAAKGILGELIKEMSDKEANVSNIFIVTHTKKSNNLFIFDSVELFYSKLGPLQREIKDPSEIEYMVLTFKDYDMEPLVMSDKDDIGDVYSVLAPLDEELKKRVLDDDDIRRHKELAIFDEILYA